MDVVKSVEAFGSQSGSTKKEIKITASGELDMDTGDVKDL